MTPGEPVRASRGDTSAGGVRSMGGRRRTTVHAKGGIRGLRGLWLAVVLAMVAVPFGAAAQERVLISNLAQGSDGVTHALSQRDFAQGFTTGDNDNGYALTSIEVVAAAAGTIDSAVLRRGNPATGTLVATLSGTGSVALGNHTFTAPSGTHLDASTQYFLVLEDTNESSTLYFHVADAGDEDGGGASGWSIENVYRERSNDALPFVQVPTPLNIRVNGTITDPPPPPRPSTHGRRPGRRRRRSARPRPRTRAWT